MRYTFIQQHDATDCAAACLAMVCLHYRKETTITRLRDMMGTDLKGTNLLGILSSVFNNVIYDEILPYKQENVLQMMILVFIGVTLTQTVVCFIREWMMLHLSLKIDIPLMLGYFEHIYKLPMKFFSTRKTGDITTRFSDAFTIKDIFTNIALTLIMDVGMALVTGVILARMNSGLFVIILFMTLVSILLVFIFKEPYKKINEEQMHQASVLNSQIIEGLRAVETIKGNANEEVELENIEREYIKSLRISYKESMLSNIQGTISSVISGAGNLVLMYCGIMQVIQGNLTLGSMMAFTTLAGYFTEPVSNLVGLQLSIQEANISMKRLSEILDYDREQSEDKKEIYQQVERIDGDISFKNVTFRCGGAGAIASATYSAWKQARNIKNKYGSSRRVKITEELTLNPLGYTCVCKKA